MRFQVEFTDTFGGEANYSWVRRAEVVAPVGSSRSLVMRRAKRALGLSGVRGKREQWWDMEVFRPYKSATIMFVTGFGG